MRRLKTLPLFWQVYALIVCILVLVVGLTEFLLEPWVEELVLGKADSGIDWYEAPVWTVSILVPSIACGVIISQKLTSRLSAMARAARTMARGNLDVRLPVSEDEKNPFNDLAQSLNHMADAITRQLKEERRLLADIAHELRSPLSRMAVAVELLEKTPDAEKQAATLRRMEKEIHRMGDLVAQLLAQGRERSREESGNRQLGPALADIVEDYRLQAGRRGITIRFSPRGISGEAIAVRASEAQLRTIFGNILDNAVFYSPQEGVIAVTVSTDGKNAVAVIRDHGPGVPDKDLGEIFRAFYRVDESRTRANGGAGLGLALARAEATRLGGGIAAENARPGLRVTVILPLTEEADNG